MQNLKNPKMKYLVDKLKSEGVITSEEVYNSMLAVDRGDFVSSFSAYEDRPQSINYQATISAPHMHAYALEKLKSRIIPGSKVLDVGSGSGYLTVAFSKLMQDEGKVIGLEHIPQLYKLALSNISKSHSELIEKGRIKLVEADGRSGYKEEAPFDVIHVGAAAESVPEELINQLATGGRLMIPVGSQEDIQYIFLIDKDSQGKITQEKFLPVKYVPLTSKEEQLNPLNF